LIEQFGAIAAALTGAFLALDKTRGALIGLLNTKPMRRKALKADLELYKLLDQGDPGHDALSEHIKTQVNALIAAEEDKELVTGNWPKMLVGLAMAGGFGFWTYRIVENPDISNWFTILTGWMALAGVGFLSNTFNRPSR
jgi:hypothetical protein